MQDRYAGDIGDYVKLAILRALMPSQRLGVAWWLYPDESHNGDGRHVDYLHSPQIWRRYDPDLFDGLAKLVATETRSVVALERACFLQDAIFANEVIPVALPVNSLIHARQAWFKQVCSTLADCNLVFVDPDNGLEPASYSLAAKSGGKSVTLDNLGILAGGRPLIVYHHQTRRKGGHLAEIDHWAERLRSAGFGTADAIRSQRISPRAFFLLDAPEDLRDRARQLVGRCQGLLTWHPDQLRRQAETC